MSEPSGIEVTEYLNNLAATFDELCEDRHQANAEKYGQFAWLGDDIVRKMIEELADTANYCRLQAIKLLMLQEHLEAELMNNEKVTSKDDIQIGFEAFKGTKEGWGTK